MAKPLSSAGKKALFRFCALVLSAVAVQGVLLLCGAAEGENGLSLYMLCFLALLPPAAVVLPCWAALGGVHPLAACLPIGGLPLLFAPPLPWYCLMCIVLSLVSAAAGQEWKKRRETEVKRGHAGKNRKK